MTRPAPTTEAVWRNSRRVTWVWAPISRLLRRAMDGGADALVGAAAADVRHRGVDIGVARAAVLGEQRYRGHDLAGLAVAALRHVLGDPGPLHGVAPARRQPFDRGHALPGRRRDRHHAGAHRGAVEMHGAGAALGDAASELRAGEAEVVAQHPQERRVGRDVHGLAFAVDGEDDRGHDALPGGGCRESWCCEGEGGRGEAEGLGDVTDWSRPAHERAPLRVDATGDLVRGAGAGLALDDVIESAARDVGELDVVVLRELAQDVLPDLLLGDAALARLAQVARSEEHTSELQSPM